MNRISSFTGWTRAPAAPIFPGYRLRGIRALPLQMVLPVLCVPGAATLSLAGEGPPELVELCPGVRIQGRVSPGLTDTEKRLICGDPKSKAWKVIPLPQMKYNLRNFLQDRALYAPAFDTIVEKHDGRTIEVTTVEVGEPTIARSLTVEGAPGGLHVERKRDIVGQAMTPALLGAVEKWAHQRLEALGYPCPKVKALGNPRTGEVHLVIRSGPLQDLLSIEEGPTPGVRAGTLRRYDAFELGKRFDGDLLDLTAYRLMNQGLFDSAYFSRGCGKEGATARQEIVEGAPHLLSFGAGVSTEGIVIGRARWEDTRLWSNASSMQLTADASTLYQDLIASMDVYFLKDPSSRQELHPEIDFTHQYTNLVEFSDFPVQLADITTLDTQAVEWRFQVGPVFDTVWSYLGLAEPLTHFLNLGAIITVTSHDYELHSLSPQDGFTVTATTAFNSRAIYASASAQRLSVQGEALWNFRHLDPPILIFGVRGGVATTVTPERPSLSNLAANPLPPNYRWYLGGSMNLRGYGVNELPNNGGVGALSSVFVGLEARLGSVLPLGIAPFVFSDEGAFGASPWTLQQPIYSSPGFGVRWNPPFGVFRATLAHGYPTNEDSHFQFYFSFGQEF